MSFFDDSAEMLENQAEQDAQTDNKYEPEAGDTLHGILLKAEAYTKGEWGPTIVVTVRNVGDEEVGGVEPGESGYLFTPTVLRRKLIDTTPAIGTAFILQYKGVITPDKGGNPYKDWTLVTESIKGEGDESKRDRALWAGIERQMSQGALQATPPTNPYGAPQAPQGDSAWKF